MKDNTKLDAEMAALSGNNDFIAPDNETYLIKGLDTTRLITKKDLPAGQIPDHFFGNPRAKVTVIEYEDFACPHCQKLSPVAEQIHIDYQKDVLFIHRAFDLHLPSSDITLSAAEAAYLAGGETAYWQMASLIYAETTWSEGWIKPGEAAKVLSSYAKSIGLNAREFSKIFDRRADNGILTKIQRDKQAGLLASVEGTPTWFLDGQVLAPDDSDIREALEEALDNS
jgi:protein-disulfide isomerase